MLVTLRYLLIIVLCFITCALHAQSKHRENSLHICWQENIKLSWNDFRGKINPYDKDSTTAANAAPEIIVRGFVDEKGKNNYKIKCTFNCDSAWVRDTTYILSAEVLVHEQMHFDLAELITRRIRLSLSQRYKEGKDLFLPETQKIIQDLLDEHDKLQDLYDAETSHGLNVNQQKRWGALISNQLYKFRAYKSTPLTCSN